MLQKGDAMNAFAEGQQIIKEATAESPRRSRREPRRGAWIRSDNRSRYQPTTGNNPPEGEDKENLWTSC